MKNELDFFNKILQEHFEYNPGAIVTIEDANGYKVQGVLTHLDIPLSTDNELMINIECVYKSFETPIATGKVIDKNGIK